MSGESVNLPVWVLDGDAVFVPLVRFAFTASLSKSVVVLCASLQDPETVLPSLNKWAELIDNQIKSIFDEATVMDARKSR